MRITGKEYVDKCRLLVKHVTEEDEYGDVKHKTIRGFLMLDNQAQNAEQGHTPLTADQQAGELSERRGVWSEG